MAAMTRPAGSAGLVLFAEVLNLRNLGPAAMVGYGNDSDSLFLMFPRLLSRQDRRRRKRQFLNTAVRVITKLASMDAIGINISESGMGLFTVANLGLGSHIEVEFRTPERPASFTRLPAIVRHRALYLYGIEFLPESGPVRIAAEGGARSDNAGSSIGS